MDKLLRTPKNHEDWIVFNRQLLKAHIALMAMTYEDLRVALERIGVVDSEVNIRTRINRGRYSAVFLLQCLRAMEIGELVLPTDTAPRTAGRRHASKAAPGSADPPRRREPPASPAASTKDGRDGAAKMAAEAKMKKTRRPGTRTT